MANKKDIKLTTDAPSSKRADLRANYAKVTGRVFNYVRVSSKDQNLARQLQAMEDFNEAHGFTDTELVQEKESGATIEKRAELQYLLKSLRKGDLVVVKSLDRLSRNYKDVTTLWQIIADKGAYITVLDMELLNTAQDNGLMGDFINGIILQILGYVAEQERLNIRARQAEGIAIAKAQGKYKGKPKMPRPEGFEYAYHNWQAKKDLPKNDPNRVTAVQVFNELKISKATFYRLVAEYEAEIKGGK